MNFGSLFAGIGGIDLGFERAGMTCAWQVDNDEFCQKVLTKHWPNVPKYGDIRNVGKQNLESVDLIAGGFPCQPYSVAGKRRGTKDDRHLWPEMLRIISELKPTWVLGENVPGIIPIFLDQAVSDLEAEGYTCTPIVLPACAFDAPHRRNRLFIVAYTKFIRQSSSGYQIQHSQTYQTRKTNFSRSTDKTERRKKLVKTWLPEPNVGRVAHGIPSRVDRLKSLGNAVVPQVAEFIGRIIMEANQYE
jgi:DNA (cytosine-5)-methyltransferase 1